MGPTAVRVNSTRDELLSHWQSTQLVEAQSVFLVRLASWSIFFVVGPWTGKHYIVNGYWPLFWSKQPVFLPYSLFFKETLKPLDSHALVCLPLLSFYSCASCISIFFYLGLYVFICAWSAIRLSLFASSKWEKITTEKRRNAQVHWWALTKRPLCVYSLHVPSPLSPHPWIEIEAKLTGEEAKLSYL